jgi:hypothetical protein
MWENAFIITAITPSAIIQHSRAINGRTGTYLKLKRVCDDAWPNEQKSFKK